MKFLNEKILPRVMKFADNKYLRAVSDGFMFIMPVIIVGSIFTLLNNFSVGGYHEFIIKVGLKPFFGIPNMVTNDLLSIYAVFFIAYFFAKEEGADPGIAGMVALFSFLAVIPFANTRSIIGDFIATQGLSLAENVVIPAANVIPMEWLGAKGLFVAIFVALTSSKIYSGLIKRNVTIKMPDSVPPAISKSFGGLFPGFISIIFFIVLNRLIAFIPIEGINGLQTAIYTIIQLPLETVVGNNIYSFVLVAFIVQLLWSVGIHGMSAVVLPIFYPIWTSLSNANIEALNNGVSAYDLPNILNRSFWQVYVILGGSGMTLGLCLLMVFKAKSKQYSTLGKLSVGANLCGINEPIIFGMPIVLNPTLLIPFIVTPLISAILAYTLTAINVLPRVSFIIPLGTPVIMSGFMSTPEGGWKIALFQAFLVVMSAAIYYPFFKVLDKKSVNLETLDN